MKNIEFILKRLKRIDINRIINIARKVQKKVKKPLIFILFDIILSSIVCGSGYMDYYEFEFYLLSMKQRKTYVTGSVNNQIVKKYNNKDFRYKFSNKDEFNKIFKKYLKRDYIVLNKNNCKAFKAFIEGKFKIIVKPINESGGKGIEIIDINKKTDSEKLFHKLVKNKKLLVEEVITQDEEMSKLYNGSVNTLRIITFLTDNNEVVILKSILKIGNNGNVDNFSSGGMYTFVDEEGKVFVPAIDEEGNIFYNHPQTNKEFIGFKIPCYEEVIKLVKEVSLVISEIRYVGWDVAISDKGPLIIEGNEYSGIFQVKPSISNIKTGDLPNFKKYMDI